MARVYVTFSIELKDGADPGRVVEEMDYELKHSEIEDCYILDSNFNRLITKWKNSNLLFSTESGTAYPRRLRLVSTEEEDD